MLPWESTVEMQLLEEHSSIIHSVVIHYLHDLSDNRPAQRTVLDRAIADLGELIVRAKDPDLKAAFGRTRCVLEHLTYFSADDMPVMDFGYFHHPVHQGVYRLRELMGACVHHGPSIARGFEAGTNPCRPEQYGLHAALVTLNAQVSAGDPWPHLAHLRDALQEHAHQCAGCPYRVMEAKTAERPAGAPGRRSTWLARLWHRICRADDAAG